MNLRHLTDDCLLSETKKLVRQEREILARVLHHFRELERRRLFDGHVSLFEYATKVCGYSEDQACRRIAAMRLIKDLPELEEHIERGDINLSHVGMAQSLFINEKKNGNDLTKEDKLEVFQAIAGQSTREAQKRVTSFASVKPSHRDSIKPLDDQSSVANFKLSNEAIAKLEQLKGLFAHQKLELGEIIEKLCDLGLEQWNPARPPQRRLNLVTKAEVRRQVWNRDGGACTECGSRHAIQEDHRLPEAMGGDYTLENIRLLCRSCNQRAAIEKFGLDKMESYFN